jgi:cardiolipin synthase
MIQFVQIHPGDLGHYGLVALTAALTLAGAGHALLYKRDHRAAVLWVALIVSLPLLGATLYFLLGVNRIKRRATLLRGGLDRYSAGQAVTCCSVDQLAAILKPEDRHLAILEAAASQELARPLLPGNRIEPLINGDTAYPAMLESIAAAQRSITLSTYIFDNDEVGRMFVAALGTAVRRGVEVRVLIDATGALYSWPSIFLGLRHARVRHARFLPAFPFGQFFSINLRNHRKILVVDGRIGITGGMNIRAGHWLARQPRAPVRDLHFRLTGPVVAHLQEVFADDWYFTTNEALRGDNWFPLLKVDGPVIARGIADGPDEDFDKMRWTIFAALTAAKRSVRVATPYFLPGPTIIAAINLAAMRGVAVDIMLPARSNLPFVQWASAAAWWQVIGHGCRLWLSPPPFDHMKLFLVDDSWTLLGSTNWDPRSLRLNFEFNIECYDSSLAGALRQWFDERLRECRQVALADVNARSLPVKLRDGAARLFTPFL